MSIRFGTDGWRAIIAEDYTFDNVRLCTQGVSMYMLQQGLAQRGLVVGYDTRFASEDFARAVAETAAGLGGIDIVVNNMGVSIRGEGDDVAYIGDELDELKRAEGLGG